MKKFRLFTLLSSFALLLVACQNPQPTVDASNSSINNSSSVSTPFEEVDYVAQTKIDLNDTSKVWAEVSVYNYVDGDTTHFRKKGEPALWVDTPKGILKARYNSCDTPESTGKVEPWGVEAKQFTRDALENAQSIIVQSDSNKWETDTTGERHLVWVWYRPTANDDYRLLNLELIQEGLAKLKSASSYSLYDTFNKANYQAIELKKRVYSDEKAPGYYYGAAQNITIMELRTNLEEYKDEKVCVNGLITYVDSVSRKAFAQDLDDETQTWYGIDLYLAYNNLPVVEVGNYVRIVGTLVYYETGGVWQISGLTYHFMNPDYEGSMKLLEEGVEFEAIEMTADELTSNADMAQSLYVKMNNLVVTDVYTTDSDNLSSDGAMTLTCKDENGKTVTIRTSVLKDADGNIVVKEDLLNKTISPVGIVTTYDGKVQIHVYTLNELNIA